MTLVFIALGNEAERLSMLSLVFLLAALSEVYRKALLCTLNRKTRAPKGHSRKTLFLLPVVTGSGM